MIDRNLQKNFFYVLALSRKSECIWFNHIMLPFIHTSFLCTHTQNHLLDSLFFFCYSLPFTIHLKTWGKKSCIIVTVLCILYQQSNWHNQKRRVEYVKCITSTNWRCFKLAIIQSIQPKWFISGLYPIPIISKECHSLTIAYFLNPFQFQIFPISFNTSLLLHQLQPDLKPHWQWKWYIVESI